MKFTRSPHAHARILEVDTSAAEKLFGVVKILTYKDVPRDSFWSLQRRTVSLGRRSFICRRLGRCRGRPKIGTLPKKRRARFASSTSSFPLCSTPKPLLNDDSPMSTLHLPDSDADWWKDTRSRQQRAMTTTPPMSWVALTRIPTWVNQRGNLTKASSDVEFDRRTSFPPGPRQRRAARTARLRRNLQK